MEIEVRLFAGLRDYVPADSASSRLRLALSAGACISDVVSALHIPAAEVGLIVVNGRYVRDLGQPLGDGAVVSLWSHVAGG